MLKRTAYCLTALAAALQTISAASYYVSTTGNDANNGSQATPWRTIQKAASTVSAGDTVNVASGTYSESVSFGRGGASGAPVTFVGPATVSSFTVSADYVTVRNFSVTTSGAPMVQWNGNNGYLSDCQFNAPSVKAIDWEGNNGVMTNLDFVGLANDCVGISTGGDTISILNSKFHDIDNCDAFVFPFGKNITIRGNLMTNCDNTGYSSLGIHSDFVQNFAYSSTGWSSNVVVEANRVVNCNVQCFMLNSANTGVPESPNIRNWTIRNNIFANSWQSGFIRMPYVNVYNNVFYKWGQANAFAFELADASGAWGGGHDAKLYNNVFLACNQSESPTWGWYVNQASNVSADYNYIGGIGYAAKNVSEPHGINGGNPLFVSESSYNFQLQAGSPLIDRGLSQGSSLSDLLGNLRPQGTSWDIGAYEYMSGSTSPVLSVTPGTLNLGTASVGTALTNYFTVQNTGSGTLTGTAAVASPFFITGSAAYSLGQGQSARITVYCSNGLAGTANGSVTFSGGGGFIASISSTATNQGPRVSAITSSGSDVDGLIAGLQVYAGSVVQYSGSATDPNNLPLTWQWIYTVNGGAEVVASSGSGTVAPISYNYVASSAGSSYVWKLRVNNGQTTAESSLSVGVEAPPVSPGNLVFNATSGTLSGAMVSSGTYISQASQTGVTDGGRAIFSFTLTNAGSFVVQGLVNAANDAANSVYMNIDADPQDPTMIWDIPLTSGFEQRIASWRGNGTVTANQFTPKLFSLAAGTHQLVIIGREANTQIQTLAIVPVPPPPSNFRIVSAGP